MTRTVKGGKRQAELELARLVAEAADPVGRLRAPVTVAELLDRWPDYSPLR